MGSAAPAKPELILLEPALQLRRGTPVAGQTGATIHRGRLGSADPNNGLTRVRGHLTHQRRPTGTGARGQSAKGQAREPGQLEAARQVAPEPSSPGLEDPHDGVSAAEVWRGGVLARALSQQPTMPAGPRQDRRCSLVPHGMKSGSVVTANAFDGCPGGRRSRSRGFLSSARFNPG